MTDWPLLECIENKEEFIEKLKKLGMVRRDWKPPKSKEEYDGGKNRGIKHHNKH